MFHFWHGFEKKASLVNAAKSGIRAAKKAKSVASGGTIDYSKLEHATEKLPMWKQKLMAKGKKPVGVETRQMPGTGGQNAPTPVKDIHAEAAEEIARRRKAVESGGYTHTMYQEAKKEG